MKLASLIAACFLFAATVSVDATPYVVTLEEIGSNVVADGSGEVDLSGLTYLSSGGPTGPYLNPGLEGSQFVIGATNSFDIYARFTGPSFGTGSGTSASTGTGDLVGFALNVQQLYVPFGYVSGDALSNSATWDDATFATLGVTPGNYTYAWGSLPDQSFTLEIGTTPLPAALPTFAVGLVALALLGRRSGAAVRGASLIGSGRIR
jgi:hypothetical protein